MVGFEIAKGSAGNVDLSGVKCAAGVDWPKAIHEGNGKCAFVVDPATTDAQVEMLAQIFTGKLGGMPWEFLGPTFEVGGLAKAKITVEGQGRKRTFRVEGVGEGRGDTFKNPVTGEEHLANVDLPDGFIWKQGRVRPWDAPRQFKRCVGGGGKVELDPVRLRLVERLAQEHPQAGANQCGAGLWVLCAPNGASFSTRTRIVSAAMTQRFITPPTNRRRISAQQQREGRRQHHAGHHHHPHGAEEQQVRRVPRGGHHPARRSGHGPVHVASHRDDPQPAEYRDGKQPDAHAKAGN